MNYYLKRNEAIAEGIQQGILQGKKEGLMQGIAQQKAKDEAIFKKNKETIAQKDNQISRQNALLNTKEEQIHLLQARLKAAGLSSEL